MATVVNIPGLFETVAGRVNAALSTRATDPFNVYFDYGHYAEVTRNLIVKDGSTTLKDKKYPLIWLVMDFEEKYNPNNNGYCFLPNVQIIIATVTDPNSTTPKRYQNNFIPRLYPVYNEFIQQLCNSNLFYEQNELDLTYTKIDRPYWGGQDSGNSTQNSFSDFIDAKQIKGLSLTVNEPVCVD